MLIGFCRFWECARSGATNAVPSFTCVRSLSERPTNVLIETKFCSSLGPNNFSCTALRGRIINAGRIESLFLVFCGLVLLILVMMPITETFFGRIFPWWLKVSLTSLLEALFVTLMLFGILGIFSKSGVHLIQRYPISSIGPALFLWGNRPDRGLGSAVWPPDFTVTNRSGDPPK